MCNLAGNDAIILSDTLAKYNYQVEIARITRMEYNYRHVVSLLGCTVDYSRFEIEALAKVQFEIFVCWLPGMAQFKHCLHSNGLTVIVCVVI